MKWVVALCLVLMSLPLGAYQNPVNYIDKVDPVQANIEAQNSARAIDDCEARLDTLESDKDTLYSQGDTLHARIDSLMTRDSVGSYCDTTGGQTIAASASATITFDKELKEDGIYTHAADDDVVVVGTAGEYHVMYTISLDPDNDGASSAIAKIAHYSGGISYAQGSISYGGAEAGANRYIYLSGMGYLSCSVNDSIAIEVTAVGDDLSTIANTVSLYIEKKH